MLYILKNNDAFFTQIFCHFTAKIFGELDKFIHRDERTQGKHMKKYFCHHYDHNQGESIT